MQNIQENNLSQTKRILLCGYFAFGIDDYGGQPVKSRELFWLLQNYYGKENVYFLETMGWKKRPVRLFFDFFKKARKSEHIIMLPAHNGLKVFSKLLCIAKSMMNKKIYYSVIGGWLGEKVRGNLGLKKNLQKFNGIWVETTSMLKDLNSQGLENVTVVPNFKSLTAVSELKTKFECPLPVCTFSRIMEEKGTEDAINAVIAVNTKAKKTIYSLDLYGQIYEPYRARFEELRNTFPDYINYKGIVPADKSVETIKNYYALLFPTHFYTEGIPGTLIDALFAGVPVITSRWVNCDDIFEDGITGWGYEFGKWEKLEQCLEKAYEHQEIFISMRRNCTKVSEMYQPEVVAKEINVLMK